MTVLPLVATVLVELFDAILTLPNVGRVLSNTTGTCPEVKAETVVPSISAWFLKSILTVTSPSVSEAFVVYFA